jgi:excisionase family DNA binding protein
MDEYYSVRQLATLIGVKPVTIRRWVQKGDLPAAKLGKEIRVKKSDFDIFFNQRRIIK